MKNRIKYTLDDVINEEFYKLPKFLFDNDFEKMSNNARVLYSLLLSRHQLSIRNEWVDSNNCVYVIMSREDMCKKLNLSENTIRKIINELKQLQLLEEKRNGQGKPNYLYLLKYKNYQSGNKVPSKTSKIKVQNTPKLSPKYNEYKYNEYKNKCNGDDNTTDTTENILSEKERRIKDIYFDCYYNFFGKEHHNLSNKAVVNAVTKINRFISNLISENEMDTDYRDLLVDMAIHFFKTVSSNDHSIIHFSEFEILKNRVYSLYPGEFGDLDYLQ